MRIQGQTWLDEVTSRFSSIVHRLESSRLLRRLIERLGLRVDRQPPKPPEQQRPEHADERSMRRMAEAEHGGMSSEESAARYERGENPGGMHHKAVRPEGPEHERPDLEEPQERKERMPRGERHIPVMRKGS